MVDLQSQYQHIKTDVDTAIQEVLNQSNYINGSPVKQFQKNLENYLGVKHVIPCGNGTDALQISLMALNLKPGDEIITVDFTFAATVEVIALLQLKPVLIDVNHDDFNMNIKALEKAITKKTKAIIPVHLFGQSADMDAIMEIANKNKLAVIEDTAQAIGADYTFKNSNTQKAGTIGDLGTTSFFPSKNLGGYGDGGAIFTNSDDLAHKIRGMVNHGMYKKYYHDIVGVNSRLDSLQAAILNVKLNRLDEYCNARRDAARFYNNAFANHPNIITPKTKCEQICVSCNCHVFHQYTLQITNGKRDDLHQYLLANNIPNAIYYPVPLHEQKAYKNDNYNDRDFPVTNRLVNDVISLPMHTELDKEQLTYISTTILNFL